MKLPSHLTRETVNMVDPFLQARGTIYDATVDKSHKMLSPGTKKPQIGGLQTFGVPLKELLKRAPQGYRVPVIVKKFCKFIEENGLGQEGIFRVNGSQRMLEKLRTNFDMYGDANLEEENDVMVVAGLLKLFLRELPESVIPEHMTSRFVAIQKENQKNSMKECEKLKSILQELPKEHYDLLKHIVRFLAIVACNEPLNKMSPMSLAIVFGPNLFRCGGGFLALKDQGSTNQLVYRFIVDYNYLFKDPNEDPPEVYWDRKKHNKVPPRPPPPKFTIEEPEMKYNPTPFPRKNKYKNSEGLQVPEIEELDNSESSVSSKGRNSYSYNSPSFSDDEMTGRLSPFHLDSDGGFSVIESPVPSARISEYVDKAIKTTVIGHLFGDDSSLLNASIDTTIREDQKEPVTDVPEVDLKNTEFVDSFPTSVAVKDRVKLFESSTVPVTEDLIKPSKQWPISKAFEMFENKGIIITQMPSLETSSHVTDHDQDQNQVDIKDFKGVRRDSSPLQMFVKPSGPQNRRAPSREMRRSSGNADEDMVKEDDLKVIPNGHLPQNNISTKDVSKSKECSRLENDINEEPKSRIAFLDIGYSSANNHGNASSPTLPDKPFVPPLDFSTLHENIGGHDAILAQKAHSVSYHHHAKDIPMTQSNEQDNDIENNVPSPLGHKVKRKAGKSMDDEDLPPFSQVDQLQYKQHSHGSADDELTVKMKSQMRKIQGLKKKIRQFEEAYENEHGFKPSYTEKASKPEIKKVLQELSRERKEAKRLKQETEMGSRSRHGSGTSSTGERPEPPDLPPSMAQTLDAILKRLKEKRKELHRPEDIELMNHEQVQEEKLAVQKALLHFEGIHGRPKTKEEKNLMRPLYDRYRTIKRLLSRQPMSSRGNSELQSVPEDETVDDEPVFATRKPVYPIRVPTAVMENDDDEDNVGPLRTLEFVVTRDFSQYHNRPVLIDDQGPYSPKARRKLMNAEDEGNKIDANLHELPVSDLHDELIKSRNAKKKLRKTLRDFEESFMQRTGRKVGREDRAPLQVQYNEYKQLKARLKLLEALLSKHQHSEV